VELDKWVTKNEGPGTLIARKVSKDGAIQRSLPLCRYPSYPRYTGPSNSAAAAKLASNYVCSAP
jgi:feruloyl esterase